MSLATLSPEQIQARAELIAWCGPDRSEAHQSQCAAVLGLTLRGLRDQLYGGKPVSQRTLTLIRGALRAPEKDVSPHD